MEEMELPERSSLLSFAGGCWERTQGEPGAYIPPVPVWVVLASVTWPILCKGVLTSSPPAPSPEPQETSPNQISFKNRGTPL